MAETPVISKSTANETAQAPEPHASTSEDVQEKPTATVDQDSALASVTETPAQSGAAVAEGAPAVGDDQNPVQPQVSLIYDCVEATMCGLINCCCF